MVITATVDDHSNLATLLVALSVLSMALAAACGRGGCSAPPVSPVGGAPDGGAELVDAAAPVDAGPCDANDPNDSANACGCCFADHTIVCPPGVVPPTAQVLTLPVCGGN